MTARLYFEFGRKMFFLGMSYILPRNRKCCVAGAWFGNLYSDNPRYFVEYLLKNSDLHVTWIGKEHLQDQLPQHQNLQFAKYGTWRATWAALRAKWWLCCEGYEDISSVPLWGRATCINFWHGITFKKMAKLSPLEIGRKEVVRRGWVGRVRHAIGIKYNAELAPRFWTSVSFPGMTEILCGSFPYYFAPERCLPYGTPRNDFLIRHSADRALIEELKRKYGQILGFPDNRKIVLYMPTYRLRSRGDSFAFYELAAERQRDWKNLMCDANAVLLEKHHFITLKNNPPPADGNGCSLPVSADKQKWINAQELMLIADVLITDYSSAFVDYALLRRPCIHFIYDYEEYKNRDSGLAYDFSEVAAGPCVKTERELFVETTKILLDGADPRGVGCGKLLTHETGHASEQVYQWMRSFT